MSTLETKESLPVSFSPLLQLEYLSANTANYDRTTKADTYLALGVRELWLIDPATGTIEVRNAAMKGERLLWKGRSYSAGEWGSSEVLRGWQVSVEEYYRYLIATPQPGE